MGEDVLRSASSVELHVVLNIMLGELECAQQLRLLVWAATPPLLVLSALLNCRRLRACFFVSACTCARRDSGLSVSQVGLNERSSRGRESAGTKHRGFFEDIVFERRRES